MLRYPNYTTTDWNGNPITANFIAGQVETYERYSYGIYECNATFANQPGSFPAFWLMSGEPCNSSFNNEIDIVELKYDHSVPTLDNNIFYYPMICGTSQTSYEFTQNNFTWGGAHKYKCIWTPSKLEFWVDNTKLKEVKNTGQFWYPQLPQRVILSQQIMPYNGSLNSIVAPQTSSFHWARVKKFFLAPEITCPTIICSSGTASMDVDPLATNISWALTPSHWFTGATTGSGTIANITASPTYHGKGKITYTFNMPSGETFTAEKEVWINGPDYSEVSFDVYKSDGTHVVSPYGYAALCPNTTYHIYVNNSGPCQTSNYTWSVPSAWTTFYTWSNMISINTNSAPGGPIAVNATTCCNSNAQIITSYMGSSYNCGSYYMVISPNPAINETTLELVADGDKTIDENTQWELEVYDQQQSLKEKNYKIKGKQTKINTSASDSGNRII